MRYFCQYYDEFINDMPEEVVENCGFLPESGWCESCPYFDLKEETPVVYHPND